MALVPLRQWVLPRCFANRRHLQELDAAKEEEAAPLSHEQAMQASWGRVLPPLSHCSCWVNVESRCGWF